MNALPLLTIATFTPLLGALVIGLMVREDPKDPAHSSNARAVALIASLATFIVTLAAYAQFDPNHSGFQLLEHHAWLPSLGVSYRLGVDGLSMTLILLSAFMTPLAILATWHAIKNRVKTCMILFLVLETMMIGSFSALDLVLFYIFFEGVLIPMFLIIGIWGGERRIYAAMKFFLYTLLGSLLMLVAILVLYQYSHSMGYEEALHTALPSDVQKLLWLAFFASFAVKLPMWPVHTWLPDAHVEAPTAGSVLLAAVLLKMGGYGFLRFSIPLFPEASQFFAPFVMTLSIVAVIYTSLVALAQEDMKKLVAYSSVAHMGFVTLGLFTFNVYGLQGAIFQMISHGLISGALFLCVGVLYDRAHTRMITAFGGLARLMPIYAVFFAVFMFGSIGLPGTSGFVGEFLVLIGTFKVNGWLAFGAGLGLILGAAYMLWLYRRVMLGAPQLQTETSVFTDLSPVEWAALLPLAVTALFFGIYPKPILSMTEPVAQKIIMDMRAHAINTPKGY
ncbi:MAG: NADH-quinone oxidoreductase subunit M [Holosporales bacterium]